MFSFFSKKILNYKNNSQTADCFNKLTLPECTRLSMLYEQKGHLYAKYARAEENPFYYDDTSLIEALKNEKVYQLKIKYKENTDKTAQIDSKSLTQDIFFEKQNATKFIDFKKISTSHTLDLDNFLNDRIPKTILRLAKNLKISIWVDTTERLNHYLNANHINILGEMCSPSPTKFFLAEENGNIFILVTAIKSFARLKHQLLQFCYANIELSNIDVIGDLSRNKIEIAGQLNHYLQKIIQQDVDEKILFIGSKEATIKGLLKSNGIVKHSKHKIDEFQFDEIVISDNNKNIQVFALNIPNGDSAYDATKIFIDRGINKIITHGAGGRLKGTGEVGNYMLVKEAHRNDEIIKLDENSIVYLENFQSFSKDSLINITVDSPLEETKTWHQQFKNYGCVDVETFHIFKAIVENKNVKVMPGLFISDLVGEKPLSENLFASPIMKNIPEFALQALNQMSNFQPVVNKKSSCSW